MRIKAIVLGASLAVLIGLALAGCGSASQSGAGTGGGDAIPLEIVNGETTRDGVTVTLQNAQAVKKTDPGRYEYSFSGTIENNSDVPVMQVVYSFSLRDASGEEYNSFSQVYDGETQALAPHAKVDFSHDGIKWGDQSVPSSVFFEIGSVTPESEMPAVRLPRQGEYLYEALGDAKLANIKQEPPVKLSFHVDQGGYGRTAIFDGGESLSEAVRLLCDIKIGAETDEMVTDNYNWIELAWADGSTTGISLNLRNLEFGAHSSFHIYELENLDAFWSYAAGYLTDDAPGYEPTDDA